MVGISTQSRNLKLIWPETFTSFPGNPSWVAPLWRFSSDDGAHWTSVQYNVFPKRPYQTTTSFRSGGRYGDDNTSPQQLIKANEEKNRFPYDNGHEFYTRKLVFNASHKDVSIHSQTFPHNILRGPLVPYGALQAVNDWMSVETFGDMDLNKASNALRQTIPTKSAATLAQFIGELIVDLPRLPFAKLNEARTLRALSAEAGGEYLNTVFAWAPLVQDVLKICKAIVYSTAILNQYERDAGRQVRRSYEYPTTFSNQLASYGQGKCLDGFIIADYTSGFNNGFYDSDFDRATGAYSSTVNTDTQYWFRGAWMYYIEGGNTIIDKINRFGQKAQKLLGVKLTPAVLWELAPWSWLADWFANMGDIFAINTALASDSLVLRYGYFMRHTTRTLVSEHSGVSFTKFTPGSVTLKAKLEEKQRIRSTPYGFGISTDAFTAQQWAILASLGLTKGDRKMWWG